MRCTWCDRTDDTATRAFVCDECIDYIAAHREGLHDTDVTDCPMCAVVRDAVERMEDERMERVHEHTSGMHAAYTDDECEMCNVALPDAADLPRIMHAHNDAPLRVCVDTPDVIGFEVDTDTLA